MCSRRRRVESAGAAAAEIYRSAARVGTRIDAAFRETSDF